MIGNSPLHLACKHLSCTAVAVGQSQENTQKMSPGTEAEVTVTQFNYVAAIFYVLNWSESLVGEPLVFLSTLHAPPLRCQQCALPSQHPQWRLTSSLTIGKIFV